MLMKNFNKLIALLLATVTLLSAAVACDNNTPSDTTGSAVVDTSTPSDTTGSEAVDTTTPDTNGDTTSATTPPEELFDTPETITIKQEGDGLNYEITRSKYSLPDSVDTQAAQQLSMYLNEKIGVKPTLETDKEKQEDSEKLEILVGATDHPEMADIFDEISYGDYAIRAVGNKLIVVAFDESGYSLALTSLQRILSRGYSRKTNTITVKTSDLNKIDKVNGQLSALPAYEGGVSYPNFDAGRVTEATKCDEIVVKSTTVDDYDAYLLKLEANGYTQYTTNNIGDNKFAIYTNNRYTVNVGYYNSSREARLLIEPKGALPTRAEDNKYNPKRDRVTTAQITMIAVGSSSSSIGLSTLIRLEDGRFIVVDGAWSSRFDHLVSTIKSQAKKYTNNPVIAAWVITHGHDDHGQLLANKYSSIQSAGITVESIILNEVSELDPYRSEGYGYTNKIIKTVAPALGADLYKPHIGQAFHIANCKIDVMFTHEGLAPERCFEFNATSTILKMTFTDSKTGEVTTFLSTGDTTGLCMNFVQKNFGDYMKCDIICPPHHCLGDNSGGNDMLKEAYAVVAPQLVVFCAGKGAEGLRTQWYNWALIDVAQNPSYKEYYFTGNKDGEGDVLVPLPYVPGTVTRVKH